MPEPPARPRPTAPASEEVERLAGVPYDPTRPDPTRTDSARHDPSWQIGTAPAARVDDAFHYYIPTGRIVLLTLLSSGLYTFYWMYITWRHYRDHTGESAYPICHALSLLLPVYQFFRLHAHLRVYQELMAERGVPNTLSPLGAALKYFGVVLLGMASLMIPVESSLTAQQQATYVIISVGQTILLAWIMWQAQSNLNRFWRRQLGMRLGSLRFSLPELTLVAVGFLLGWGMLLVILIDPTLLQTNAAPNA